jgi:RNA polymerase sigma factor (TIGR02999 family)
MSYESRADLTHLMERVRSGEEGARDELVTIVYDELRRVAARLMRRERPDHTLAATGVVHEAVIRLLDGEVLESAPDRSYLFAAAARAMREVLIDHARKRATDRRGGGRERVPLDLAIDYFATEGLDVLALNEALDKLAALDERQSEIISLRYFCGLTVPEIADAFGVSVGTVERDWRIARAWLRNELKAEDEDGEVE